MKTFFYILLGLFLCLTANSQEILSQPDAKLITTFPFKQYSGGVMVIQAKVANVPDSLNFILDTGSGGISLDSSTCEEFKIHTVATDTTITGIGGIRKVPFVFDETLHLPGLDVHHLNFHVNNYDVLTSVYGEKVDGIIGYSFFSRYIVAVNFDSGYIQVYQPGKIKYPQNGTILHPVFTALPIQWATIKDRKKMGYNFYLDTGAGLCVLLSEEFAEDSAVLLSRRKPVITQAQGMGGRLQMRLTLMKEIKIGPYRFRQVPTYLYNDSYNVTSFPFTGGLIGNDLMRRFNMTFNYPKREIHISPNGHFNEKFDYAYTGLGLYYENGKIIIGDVIPGSPADKAKLKSGDELFAVGNNLSHNIMTYKNILQTPDQDLKLIIKRDDNYLTITMHTGRIR
ncbi:MAG: aspartyl protease family protein [Bacteroidetes bacterium]|nr:aspartyl protease family protein [Bacteroidota bacterium]